MNPALSSESGNASRKGRVRILVVTGASGGHIFPAISFLEELRDNYREIDTLLVLPRESLRIKDMPKGIRVKYICISRLKAGFDFRNFAAAFNFFKGCFESLFILSEFKPDIVVGFGSLNSIPLVMLAWLFRIKTLIHEQNVLPGRANRLLAQLADITALSFLRTKGYLGNAGSRSVLTGNPVRRQLKIVDKNEALSFLGLKRDRFTVLIAGGSSASHRINLSFLEAASAFKEDTDFQAVHLCGEKDYNYLENSCPGLKINIKLFSFLADMQYAYSAADLVFCRAGGSTIAELIRYRKPAVIIPYPFAYKHQTSNAQVLEEIGAAEVIRDEDLTAGALEGILRNLMARPEKLTAMQEAYDTFPKTDAAVLLAEAALALDK